VVRRNLGRPKPADPAAVAALGAELGLPEAIAAVLVRRGYADPAAAKAFLRPSLEDLHDPWALPDMEAAVARIAAAIDDGERILVHGDYDVDGVCGTTLLTRALRELGARVEPFVPNRLEHGYDFGPAGLGAALERKCGLVLTCDCGIAAHEAVAAARDAGIDVVVSDHHTPSPELPPALAVLNPHRDDSSYPEKVLCGAGVAFKLLQALFERRGRVVQDLYKYLDLVGIPTIADLVPLIGENRTLARFGLKVLERTPNPGLRALLRVSGLKAGRAISAGQIAFVIGPRINAVGRMGEAMRGVRLLLMEDEAEAAVIADVVEAENRHRREVDRATLEEAQQIIEESFDPESDRAIVLASQNWHPGVIGIVASRIVERYYRPTVLIALDGDSGRGSGRSIPGFHLYDALRTCESHLLQFGGHRAAAGVQIRTDEVEAFRDSLNAVAHEWLEPQDLVPTIRIDHELGMSEVSAGLWRFLKHFGPYGQGNPKPVFLARDVALRGVPEVVGDDHLRLRIDVGDGATPEAIAFGQAAEIDWLDESSRVDLAFQVGVREWQGVEYVQVQVLDVRPSEAVWARSES
jgi:single-stranded-DNA-specific exonuclease